MTISTVSNTITYTGNGVTTSFAYDFIIPEAGDAVVSVYDSVTLVSTTLLTSQYTITGLDNPNGGTVTYPLIGSPIASTKTITIQRILTLDQDTDLANQGGYYPDVVEAALDKVTMLCQQLQAEVANALAFPIGASSVTVAQLITQILASSANATAAAASAAAAAASAASVAAALPISAANLGTDAVTSIKITAGAVTPVKLATASIPPGVSLINGTIVESHAGNAVTFAIKTLAGTDPTAANPVICVFRDTSVATGGYTVLSLVAALSLTISSGSTLGAANATAFRVWLVLFNDANNVRLGAINCRSGLTIYPLGANLVASSTAEGGLGAADSAQVFYTGVAVASKSYSVIGFVTYETGLTTAGTWDASPTRIQEMSLGVPLPGKEVQRQSNFVNAVATGTTTIPADDTIPQITEGDQYMTQAITPSSAANLLEIEGLGMFSNSAGTQQMAMALFQDATANALAVVYDGRPTLGMPAPLRVFWLMLAAVVVATTFRLRAGGSAAGTVTFNGVAGARRYGGVAGSFMSVKEIMA